MTNKLNWDRIKQLDADLKADGWEKDHKLLFIMIEKTGKAKKTIISFQDLHLFCWNLVDNDTLNVLTFVIQDMEGRVLYRHRQVVYNEEVPIGGNGDIIMQWTTLTDEEKETFMEILVSQINAYER